jgi:hypoxanthine phosphoribosyltransferase
MGCFLLWSQLTILEATMTMKVLFTERQIQSAVQRIAMEISTEFEGQDIILVCVLKGSIIFTSDLVREIERISMGDKGVTSCRLEFMRASSYGDSQEPGDVEITLDVDHSLRGQNVILVEDIADTCQTLARLIALLMIKEPAELRTAVLLTKPHKHQREVLMDYVGFAGDESVGFVVGYGMDNAGTMRGLPHIGQIE